MFGSELNTKFSCLTLSWPELQDLKRPDCFFFFFLNAAWSVEVYVLGNMSIGMIRYTLAPAQ